MASEFSLIARYFTRPPRHADLGVGDDAALITPSPGQQLVISSDMLVSGRHFFPDTDPRQLGWKALAVNLSDIAAMGARARWVTLALALPAADEAWLSAFAEGFFACAEAYGIDLVGGDTTCGPLNLCPTIFGEVPTGQAIRRDGARPGDLLWVSGQPGRAVLALRELRGELTLPVAVRAPFHAALLQPQPRCALGLALRGIASAMLDISDGLVGDLAHILERSGVGAQLQASLLPIPALCAAGIDAETARAALLYGGDDYELLFAAPPHHGTLLEALAQQLALPLHCIGEITATPGIALIHPNGDTRPLRPAGFDHFSTEA